MWISLLANISVTTKSDKLWLTWSVVCVVVVPWQKFKDISMIFRPPFLPNVLKFLPGNNSDTFNTPGKSEFI